MLFSRKKHHLHFHVKSRRKQLMTHKFRDLNVKYSALKDVMLLQIIRLHARSKKVPNHHFCYIFNSAMQAYFMFQLASRQITPYLTI